MKKVVVIGAGPAGITAAYELIKQKNEFDVTVLEAEDSVGGISKTVTFDGNRMDIGGHRFFSKSQKVNEWWLNILPLQAEPAMDYKLTNRNPEIAEKGPNPEKTDRVMLKRERISRIFYKRKFFDYPIKLNFKTIFNLGIFNTFLSGMSYLVSLVRKLPETSLENFYINRFGRRLYQTFFEGYTQKVWGKHPSKLSADWGAQRVKGISIIAILKDILYSVFHIKHKVETSLIEEFYYPKLGVGQIWETALNDFAAAGGKFIKNAEVVEIDNSNGKIKKVGYKHDGKTIYIDADIIISSMPLKDLAGALIEIQADMREIAENLPYRDFIAVGMLVKKLKPKNRTAIKTLNNLIPDCWMYVQDDGVKLGRIQIYNNWSPYMLKEPEQNVWLGLEYFCTENDELWRLEKEQWRTLAVSELLKIGIISDESDVLAHCVTKVKKAYPAYFGSYDKINKLREYLNRIENFYCIGRNGQHRYNNMDHSMLTAFATVDHINGKLKNKEDIWKVNTESEYHEEQSLKSN